MSKPNADGTSTSSSNSSGNSAVLVTAELPWGGMKLLGPTAVDPGLKPGEFVAQTLFMDFVLMADRKIQMVLHEPIEKLLTKSLQRGEDAHFDQLISALSSVAENCMPSMLRALFAWHEQQQRWVSYAIQQRHAGTPKAEGGAAAGAKALVLAKASGSEVRQERDYQLEKKGMAIDFIFCMVLIEVLKQLPLHPGQDDLVNHVTNLAFKQFRYKDVNLLGLSATNAHVIADLFAEVVGVIAASRFRIVRNKFMQELNEMRQKEATPLVVHNVVSLLMGMKFFRVKMVPIEEFEQSMGFLHELAGYFLEVKDRDKEIKHAIAGLFVEILLPVAASVKNEVNIPVLKSLVEQLYTPSLDWASKKRHSLAFFPLLTCLLCISHKSFFLSNWHCFLTMCLANLRHKDSKMSRVALESLYRLLWVYVIRIKCESNTATHSRLQSIVHSLFPKGSRNVTPRDAPLNIFVKIIHFIAQERLDFAFREVIFDLLSVNRPIRTIYQERMNIGLRSLLVIADSLQQRDGAPPMPRTIGVLPSGNTLRVKKTFLTKPLTTETARMIGLEGYYAPCRRALDGIIRALDLQVGRPLMMTLTQNSGKEPDELMGGERKPKLDLFRTCIAAIPRIMPEGMSRQDLLDLLCRLTIHMDEELRGLACQTMQNLLVECVDWRDDVVHGFLQLIVKEVHDSFPQLVDSALLMLLQLIRSWKNVLQGGPGHLILRRESNSSLSENAANASRNVDMNMPQQLKVSPVFRSESRSLVLHCVEGLALVMLCQGRAHPRKLAITILKEVKSLLPLLCLDEVYEKPVIDLLDSVVGYVADRYIAHVSPAEKQNWAGCDFAWFADKITNQIETDPTLVNSDLGNEYFQWDAWAAALSGFLEPRFLHCHCPTALAFAWPAAHSRMTSVFTFVDPNNSQNDNRASLLRSSKSKATSGQMGESLNYSNYLSLWQKYLVFACGVAPPAPSSVPPVLRSASPDTLQNCGEYGDALASDMRIPRLANVSAPNLFKLIVPLLRSELTDMRDSVVLGLGSVSPGSFDCLLDELGPFLREAAERKQENVRRRRRRDLLRLQLIRLVEVAVHRRTLSIAIESDSGLLKQPFVDFIENTRVHLDGDHDRDQMILHAMRLHFAKLISTLIKAIPVEKRHYLLPRDLRHQLFYLFAQWSGRLGLSFDRKHSREKISSNVSGLEYFSVCGMCGVLCCGPIFDVGAIHEHGYIYPWLESLLHSQNDKIGSLAEESLVLLLEFNTDSRSLLDWIVEQCYTGPALVADRCFRALAIVFSTRDYPCDLDSIISLTLMYCGYAVVELQQIAVELLQLLEQRFFGEENLRYSAQSCSEETPGNGTPLGDGSPPSGGSPTGEPVSTTLEACFSKSQLFLSQQLAEMHPEMTLGMFSEITQRFQTARPARRAALLHLLVPWLHNVELVDGDMDKSDFRVPTLSMSTKINESHALARRVLKGEGWGSPQASDMLLNNLLHLTIKFGNEHNRQIEALWAALVLSWPQNLQVITRYLSVMATLAADKILPFAKRVVIYLARINSERLVSEMMNELQTIDPWKCPLERTDVVPYYRWVKRDDDEDAEGGDQVTRQQSAASRGTIHTKRHTPSEESPLQEMFEDETSNLAPSASMASLITLKADVLNARFQQQAILEQEEEDPPVKMRSHTEHAQPFILPMPAYGGYYSLMPEFLPSSQQPVQTFHRCYLALALVSDLIVSDVEIDWTVHLPLMLHVSVLGLDHSRELVHEHCQLVIIRIILAHTGKAVPPRDLAKVLISHSLALSKALPSESQMNRSNNNVANRSSVHTYSSMSTVCAAHSNIGDTQMGLGGASNAGGHSGGAANSRPVQPLSSDIIIQKDTITAKFGSVAELAVAVTDLLASRKGNPIWTWEDITARTWRNQSTNQLSSFVSHLSRLLSELLPGTHLSSRWAQTALHVALSCSSRHYAGRSFQIFRALNYPLTSQMLSDILSRLVETVSEHGEDMQGYVTEIMLTLDAAVLHLELAEHSALESTTPPYVSPCGVVSPPAGGCGSGLTRSPTHARSTSCSVTPTVVNKRSPQQRDNVRHSSGDAAGVADASNLPRSKSAQALKSEDQDDHLAALAQLLWISVSLLDSEYEHEFLLALKLLDKLIDLSPIELQEILDRLCRMVQQLGWNNFPGILNLICKGCIFTAAFESTLALLSKFILLLDYNMVDVTPGSSGFALNVMALLPYLVLHYEEPTKVCIQAADNIAERCTIEVEHQSSSRDQGSVSSTMSSNGTLGETSLDHLGTVMKLYSRRGFSKEVGQWMRCVVKYLQDCYPAVMSQLLAFLTEMLEKGPALLHQPVLQIMFCMFSHVDLHNAQPIRINGDFLTVVSKHLLTTHWREATRILKLAVTRSSCLSVPPTGYGPPRDIPSPDPADHLSVRKELPGRTLDFNVDLGSIHGRPHGGPGAGQPSPGAPSSASSASGSSGNRSSSTGDSAFVSNPPAPPPAILPSIKNSQQATAISATDTSPKKQQGSSDTLRKPWVSQMKVREHLVNLLNASGLRVGLPKSPSVIFSQSSHDLQNERHSSVYSSSGELTGGDGQSTTPSPENQQDDSDTTFPPVFKEFDFLDGEIDSMSESAESCFNWVGVLRPRSHSYAQDEENLSQNGASSITGSVPNLPHANSESDSSEDEEEDEESNSSQLEEECGTESVTALEMERLFVNSANGNLTPTDNRPATPASLTLSMGSIGELRAVNSPLPPPALILECPHHSSGTVEDAWNRHVTSNDAHSQGNTPLLFSQLYKEACGKVSYLIRDGCHFLSTTDQFQDIVSQFLRGLDILIRVSDCPFAFVTSQFMTNERFIRNPRFFVLELKEHYETFLEKKEYAIRCLNAVKSGKKLRLLAGHQRGDNCKYEPELDLCKSLQKLFFHVKVLYDSFRSMIRQLEIAAAKHEQVRNLSAEVTSLHKAIICALSEMTENDSPPPVKGSPSQTALAQLLQAGHTKDALTLLRYARHQSNRGEFGCCEEEDVEVLLLFYCQLLAENFPCCMMVVECEPGLEENCGLMQETLMALSSAIGVVENVGRLSHHESVSSMDV